MSDKVDYKHIERTARPWICADCGVVVPAGESMKEVRIVTKGGSLWTVKRICEGCFQTFVETLNQADASLLEAALESPGQAK